MAHWFLIRSYSEVRETSNIPTREILPVEILASPGKRHQPWYSICWLCLCNTLFSWRFYMNFVEMFQSCRDLLAHVLPQDLMLIKDQWFALETGAKRKWEKWNIVSCFEREVPPISWSGLFVSLIEYCLLTAAVFEVLVVGVLYVFSK